MKNKIKVGDLFTVNYNEWSDEDEIYYLYTFKDLVMKVTSVEDKQIKSVSLDWKRELIIYKDKLINLLDDKSLILHRKEIDDKIDNIIEGLYQTYQQKNHDYDNSFNKSCYKFGVISSIVRIGDKINRLDTLVAKENKVKSESINDILLDIINYCVLSINWSIVSNKYKEETILSVYNDIKRMAKSDSIDNIESIKKNGVKDKIDFLKKYFDSLNPQDNLSYFFDVYRNTALLSLSLLLYYDIYEHTPEEDNNLRDMQYTNTSDCVNDKLTNEDKEYLLNICSRVDKSWGHITTIKERGRGNEDIQLLVSCVYDDIDSINKSLLELDKKYNFIGNLFE